MNRSYLFHYTTALTVLTASLLLILGNHRTNGTHFTEVDDQQKISVLKSNHMFNHNQVSNREKPLEIYLSRVEDDELIPPAR
ncbi:MAG: hypothetical protein ACFBSC_20725 [Microcoleaceae cyanobacterium]